MYLANKDNFIDFLWIINTEMINTDEQMYKGAAIEYRNGLCSYSDRMREIHKNLDEYHKLRIYELFILEGFSDYFEKDPGMKKARDFIRDFLILEGN